MQILTLSVALIPVITNLNTVRAQILTHLIMLRVAFVSSISKVMFELFYSSRYAGIFMVRI